MTREEAIEILRKRRTCALYLCYCEGGDCYVFWLDNEPWAEETVEKARIITWQPLPEIYRPEGEKK